MWISQMPLYDGLVQACSNPSAWARELLQSCAKPLSHHKRQDSVWRYTVMEISLIGAENLQQFYLSHPIE